MATPLEHYRVDLQRADFSVDPAQQRAVDRLEALYWQLVQPRRQGVWKRLFGGGVDSVRGMYLWGDVGRGKTYLMDIFFDALPFEHKLRLHFHRFMRRVHADLVLYRGEKNPLEKVADDIAAQAKVLCFDEFYVTDITDAMILANMLEALFARDVTLVTTSNIVPDELYRDGLQRSRFLPAIDLLKRHTEVFHVDGGIDYRLRALERVELYHSPWDTQARQVMEENFIRLVADDEEIEREGTLEIEGRAIEYVAICEDVVWFDFFAICDGPRSQNDYIEVAREFHTVLISNVPVFDGQDDLARRFVHLVDEFYDRRVNLVLGASVALEALYADGRLGFEFERTRSRLLEMQSTAYLGDAHRA